MKQRFLKQNKGQAMILSVMMLGGVLMGAAATAGLLMVYQIRASNDVVNSAKAVFAADAGIEMASWCFFVPNSDCPPLNSPDNPAVVFDDGAVRFEVDSNQTVDELTITSRGLAAQGETIRILETVLVSD